VSCGGFVTEIQGIDYSIIHCKEPVCICVLTLSEIAIIFVMDVAVWELLKFMFRKEIKEFGEYLDGKLNKPPLVK
jgi:hypothetical protein